MTFSDLELIEPIYKAVLKEGYTDPTPIQAQAIPKLLEGKDLIGIAQTGTGKSAAFILPLLQKLEVEHKKIVKNYPSALILAPTRELAAQIADSCATYSRYTNIKHTVIFGGVSQRPQVKDLARGVDILVATPGRLIDLMEQRHIFLENIDTFILDEADRMLDMGFVQDIRQLLPHIPKECQTIMFSATMSKEVTKLAHDFLKDPVRIEISQEGSTVDKIDQQLFYTKKTDKVALLLYLMKKDLDHVLIFSRTKAGADRIAKALSHEGIRTEAIHSDKSQAQRTRVLEKFQRGKIVLVATDIAARGIDVNGISHVINFDLPNDSENYIHRIGRTARAGAEGTAYSFCDETEKMYLRGIEKIIKQKIPIADHPFHSEEALNSTQRPPARGGRARGGFSSQSPRRRFGGRDSGSRGSGRPKRSEGRSNSRNGPRKRLSRDGPKREGRSSEGRSRSERKPFSRDGPKREGRSTESRSPRRESSSDSERPKRSYGGPKRESTGRSEERSFGRPRNSKGSDKPKRSYGGPKRESTGRSEGRSERPKERFSKKFEGKPRSEGRSERPRSESSGEKKSFAKKKRW